MTIVSILIQPLSTSGSDKKREINTIRSQLCGAVNLMAIRYGISLGHKRILKAVSSNPLCEAFDSALFGAVGPGRVDSGNLVLRRYVSPPDPDAVAQQTPFPTDKISLSRGDSPQTTVRNAKVYAAVHGCGIIAYIVPANAFLDMADVLRGKNEIPAHLLPAGNGIHALEFSRDLTRIIYTAGSRMPQPPAQVAHNISWEKPGTILSNTLPVNTVRVAGEPEVA